MTSNSALSVDELDWHLWRHQGAAPYAKTDAHRALLYFRHVKVWVIRWHGRHDPLTCFYVYANYYRQEGLDMDKWIDLDPCSAQCVLNYLITTHGEPTNGRQASYPTGTAPDAGTADQAGADQANA